MLTRNRESFSEEDVHWADLVLAAGGMCIHRACMIVCLYNGYISMQVMGISCSQPRKCTHRTNWLWV